MSMQVCVQPHTLALNATLLALAAAAPLLLRRPPPTAVDRYFIEYCIDLYRVICSALISYFNAVVTHFDITCID